MRLPDPKNQNYLNRYIKLLANVPTIAADEYTEDHHYLPECMGGPDTPNNMITLPSRYHFLAHWMLWKAYDTDELAYAFWAMCHQKKKGQENRYTKINSKTYAVLKAHRSKLIKESNSRRWDDPEWAEKTRANISAGRLNNKELTKKASDLLTARNADPEHQRLINEGKEKFKQDKERYDAWRKSTKAGAAKRIRPVIVNGITYTNAAEVSQVFGISIPTVRQRIRSKTDQFSNWKYK